MEAFGGKRKCLWILFISVIVILLVLLVIGAIVLLVRDSQVEAIHERPSQEPDGPKKAKVQQVNGLWADKVELLCTGLLAMMRSQLGYMHAMSMSCYFPQQYSHTRIKKILTNLEKAFNYIWSCLLAGLLLCIEAKRLFQSEKEQLDKGEFTLTNDDGIETMGCLDCFRPLCLLIMPFCFGFIFYRLKEMHLLLTERVL